MRRRQRAADSRIRPERAADLVMSGDARPRSDVEIVPVELQRQGRAAPRCVAADLPATIGQCQARHREVVAVRGQAQRRVSWNFAAPSVPFSRASCRSNAPVRGGSPPSRSTPRSAALHIAAGVGAEREAAGTGLSSFSDALAMFPPAKATPATSPDRNRTAYPASSATFAPRRDVAERDPPAAVAGRQPVAVQLSGPAAWPRCAASFACRSILPASGMPASRDHGARSADARRACRWSAACEIDMQIAIDTAAGRLDTSACGPRDRSGRRAGARLPACHRDRRRGNRR